MILLAMTVSSTRHYLWMIGRRQMAKTDGRLCESARLAVQTPCASKNDLRGLRNEIRSLSA